MLGKKTAFRQWLDQPIPANARPMQATDASLPIAVIGAGPAGLAAMAAFQQADIPFVGIELHSAVGGIWDQTNPASTVYDQMNTNTSRDTTHLGPPMPGDWPTYPHHSQAKDYLQQFGEKQGLLPNLRFNTRFLDAKKTGAGSWKVELQSVDSQVRSELVARAIVIATGVHNQLQQNTPHHLWDEAIASGASVIHASAYRSAQNYTGQRVLVIGLGQTGTDVAHEISQHAKCVVLASRSTPWIFPSMALGKPADQLEDENSQWVPNWIQTSIGTVLQRLYVGHPTRLGVPSPDHRLLEKFAVTDRGFFKAALSGQIAVRPDLTGFAPGGVAKFGSSPSEETFDTVVFATGYHRRYPLLEKPDGAELADALRFLVFHDQQPGLNFMSEMIATRGCWPAFVHQGRTIAAYFSAEQHGKKNVDQFNRRRANPSPDFKGRVFLKADKFHIDFFRYTRAMRDLEDWLEA